MCSTSMLLLTPLIGRDERMNLTASYKGWFILQLKDLGKDKTLKTYSSHTIISDLSRIFCGKIVVTFYKLLYSRKICSLVIRNWKEVNDLRIANNHFCYLSSIDSIMMSKSLSKCWKFPKSVIPFVRRGFHSFRVDLCGSLFQKSSLDSL